MGTRIPPSYKVHLPPRSGPLLAPALKRPPLSLPNITSVLSLRPVSRSTARTFPAQWSRCSIKATSLARLALRSGSRWVTLCSHSFYQRAIEYFESLGAYRTVWEEDGID